MRYIDLSQLGNSQPKAWKAWKDKAKKVKDEVLAEPDPKKRKAIITKNQKVYQEAKAFLTELSHGKCWYCESKEIRSDMAVDHFRPKNSVVECPSHTGYYWLAFDWENLRLACTYCNSRRNEDNTRGGKHDHFPLVEICMANYKYGNPECSSIDSCTGLKPECEGNRVIAPPNNNNAYIQERCLLLDPTVVSDVSLLTFDPTGDAIPSVSKNTDRFKFERAEKSIQLYHLHEENLVEARKSLYNEVKDKIQDGERKWELLTIDSEAKKDFKKIVAWLKNRIKDSTELSMVAKAYIREYEIINAYPWLTQVYN